MLEIGSQMVARVREALPGAAVYWEKEPSGVLNGAVLTAELKHKKFTLQFESNPETGEEGYDSSLIDQVVDDFVDFFERSIYQKEKFTRIV